MAPDPGPGCKQQSVTVTMFEPYSNGVNHINQSFVKEETRIGVSDMRHISLWEVGPFRAGRPPASQK